MPNVMIFCPEPTSGNNAGNAMVNGYAKENSTDQIIQYTVELNYNLNAAQMTTVIVNAVKAGFLTEHNIVIGPTDKVFMFGTVSQV